MKDNPPVVASRPSTWTPYASPAKIISFRRIDATFLSVDNDPTDESTQGEATGPGCVRIFQLGNKGDPLNNGSGARSQGSDAKGQRSEDRGQGPGGRRQGSGTKGQESTSGQETEFKLTQVYFEGRMTTNNKRSIVTFYDKVAAVHFPTDDPDYKLLPGRLPPGGMALMCGRLEVYSRKQPDNTTTKEMRAYRNAVVEGQGFSGRGDIVKYDESKEQIIFEGEGLSSPAVLYRQRIPGAKPDSVIARKIIYWRIPGTYDVEDARNLNLSK